MSAALLSYDELRGLQHALFTELRGSVLGVSYVTSRQLDAGELTFFVGVEDVSGAKLPESFQGYPVLGVEAERAQSAIAHRNDLCHPDDEQP